MNLRTIESLLDRLVHEVRTSQDLAEFVKHAKTLNLEGRDREIVNEFYVARKQELE